MDKYYSGGFLYNPKTACVLLHKRDSNTKINPNKWAFFGGLNELDETPKQTFIREIKEELEVELSETELIPLCDYLNEELQTYRFIFYAQCDLDKSQMHLNEGADFDWIPISRLFEYDLTSFTVDDLELFREKLEA